MKYIVPQVILTSFLFVLFISGSSLADDDKVFTSPAIGAKFVLIPAGMFSMGSPPNEQGRGIDETLHQVTISKPFYMQTTLVTQGQWKKVKGSNPSSFRKCGDDCPVENVSWYDVQDFIKKLNQLEGNNRYRLPTEAEWEYAARAGTTTPFFTGNCLSTDQANYNGDYPLTGCPKGKFREKTVRVGSFTANAWGLYDMHGNVFEWCHDWYGNYPSENVTDPTGPPTGSGKVLRGGHWRTYARFCRSAYRDAITPATCADIVGFRLVMTP
ncbi:MAG TPA: formylglycine-generating enzyme family protein [Syntrophales bacterium]|nr:formylglycine-generating enzyme family protein [Syntrophales bacterium]